MSMAILIPIIVMIITFILRMPIPLGMLSGSVFYLLISGYDVGLVAENVLMTLYTKYIIIAVPLFIFTAKIMNAGEITDIIFKFANILVGRLKGGMGHVNVLASIIFSGMTGSAVADASGLGLMEIEAMRKEGYDDGFSCAVTAASATIGPIFPPSIPMIYYAMYSGTSIGALFLGGMVPGLLIGIALMLYIAYVAKRRNYPSGTSYTISQIIIFTLKALPALFTPVILLGGIYTGVMTPTEAGAVAAVYAIIISIFAYHVLGLKRFIDVVIESTITTGIVGLMVSAAATFSFIVSLENLPEIFGEFMLNLTTNKFILLLATNILFLLLGMFVNTSTISLVFIPMMLPLIEELGIDLVHFGVVIVLNMMIGLSTPPFGMLLFITSGISGTPLAEIIKEIIPMIIVMVGVLFLVTFIPNIVLFLPSLLSK